MDFLMKQQKLCAKREAPEEMQVLSMHKDSTCTKTVLKAN